MLKVKTAVKTETGRSFISHFRLRMHENVDTNDV